MNTKTMEGLVGAETNINMVNTPMRVYKEARRKGDTAVMERAMGYAGEFAGKAEEYKAEADEGMKEDAETARERANLQREKAIEMRREENDKIEERADESRKAKEDKVEISEDGKALLEENTGSDNAVFSVTKAATYSKAEEVSQTGLEFRI